LKTQTAHIYAEYYPPFGSVMSERTWEAGSGYRYGFNGKEVENEIHINASLDFGARTYSSLLGRWLSIDPHSSQYPGLTPYCFVANNPIVAIDPDGKDIIILLDKNAAGNAGHQAVLIGNNRDGWTYISKDGAEEGKSGAIGKSRFVVMTFSSIEDFRNSVHNFDTKEYHSLVGGGENKDVTYLLDDKGQKIQRYEEAFYIGTTQSDGSSTDEESINAAKEHAGWKYYLGFDDCSHVVSAALEIAEDSNGNELKSGEPTKDSNSGFDLTPRNKQDKIEERNKNSGVDYDQGIVPEDKTLHAGEKGEKI
jgi:RHS repeat-associated protein